MVPSFRRSAMVTALGLVALTLWSVRRDTRPPRPVPASAGGQVFSAARAMRHVRAIAERPHAVGMADHDRVRDYVVAQLAAMGVRAEVQRATGIGTRYQDAGRVANIVARISGTGAAHRAVLLVAHYDGVPAGPAAADDGAGTAALLEVVRALRAAPPLVNDVIVLVTDGEEPGLLGAAAFARGHPWARDVDVILNVEARGTGGRSYMFETGAGNLDAVRVLRSARDVTAGSVFVTVYRTLPNDTDLSELIALDKPALNFAFADGVDRYHTSHDAPAYLDEGSLQHHGDQILALTRAFGNGPLPRPRTGDAIFFDLPLVGLVLYPMSWALATAILAAVLVVLVGVRAAGTQARASAPVRDVALGGVLGVAATVAALVLSLVVYYGAGTALVAIHRVLPWGGAPQWSSVYAAALALLAVAATTACWALARRRASFAAAHAGVLLVWAVFAVLLAIVAPGASYLLVWPLAFAAAAALMPPGRVRLAADWIASAVTLLMLAGLAFTTSAVLLGVQPQGGGLALAVTASLVTLLLAPMLERMNGNARWLVARASFAGALVLVVIGLFEVRRSGAHPEVSALSYVVNADSDEAFLATPRRYSQGVWTRSVFGAGQPAPAWLSQQIFGGGSAVARRVPLIALAAPDVRVVSDSASEGRRFVVLRVTAPPGTAMLMMHAVDAPVFESAIDGYAVDTTRYRRRRPSWHMTYWAPGDSGVLVALTTWRRPLAFDVVGYTPGVPRIPGMPLPARPDDVVPVQMGDGTFVWRRVRF